MVTQQKRKDLETQNPHATKSRGPLHSSETFKTVISQRAKNKTSLKKYLPLTVLHTILLGARKWNGPLLGFVLVRFRKKSRYFTMKSKHHFICYNSAFKSLKSKH